MIFLWYIINAEYPGELHIPAVQCAVSHILDLHVQEGPGDEEQNIRRDSRSVPTRQRKVSYCKCTSVCRLIIFTYVYEKYTQYIRAQRKST